MSMTGEPISALPKASTLTGTELGVCVQGGVTKNFSLNTLPNGGAVDVFSFATAGDQAAIIARSGADVTYAVTAALAALPANGGRLYFRAGRYVTQGGFTISVPTQIVGDGQAQFPGPPFDTAPVTCISQIECTSSTAVLFTVTANYALFKDIGLVNTSLTTPTAGSGIYVNGANVQQKVDHDNVFVARFYDNVDQAVNQDSFMRNCYNMESQRYGLRIRNVLNPDAGDFKVHHCAFWGGQAAGGAPQGLSCIRYESSGAVMIANNAIGGHCPHGIWIDTGVTPLSSQVQISGNKMEDFTDVPIKVDNCFPYLVINGNSVRSTVGTVPCITLNNINEVLIGPNMLFGTNTSQQIPAITLQNINLATILPQQAQDFGWVTQTLGGCQNINDYTSLYSGKSERFILRQSTIVKQSDTVLTPAFPIDIQNATAIYQFRAVLLCSANTAGGIKVGIDTTAAVTTYFAEATVISRSTNAILANTFLTAAGQSVSASGAGSDLTAVYVDGNIFVSGIGRLVITFAQSISNANPSTILAGSYVEVKQGGAFFPAGGATLNPSDKNAAVLLSENNLLATNSSTANNVTFGGVRATTSKNTGKWYFEFINIVQDASGGSAAGLADASANLALHLGDDAHGWSMFKGYGFGWHNNANGPAVSARNVVGDIYQYAVDLDAGNMWFGINGVWQASGNPNTGANPIFTFTPGTTLFPACNTDGDGTRAGAWLFAMGFETCWFQPPTNFRYWSRTS